MSNSSNCRKRSLAHRASANSTTETCGGLLPDGRSVDLISDVATGRMKLISFDGIEHQIADRVDVGDHTFISMALDSAIRGATALPTTAEDYETTEGLFAETRGVMTAHGFSQEVATAATNFIFATWFPEAGAPCMTITGPSAEGILFLQLLACFVRRGLMMVELDSHGFRGLMDRLHPTLLIDARCFTSRSLRRLLTSSGSRFYVPWKGSVANFSFARAIYLGTGPAADFSADFSLHVHISPSRPGLFLLDEKERVQIIATFQPKFLNYRLRNINRVRASDFELSEMDSEAGIIGRILGSCIVDAPEIQAGVRRLLESREAKLRAARWTDLSCVILEALLDICHRPASNRIYVGEIAETARVILKTRGNPAEFKARGVGPILRRLGFNTSPRDYRGFHILVTSEVLRTIHLLARDYKIAAVENGIACCPMCTETFRVVPGVTDPVCDMHGERPV
jgi:hypothetical protein